ncbi:hypothetical protein PS1_006786 [Malus domestica]
MGEDQPGLHHDQPELQHMELSECAFYGTHRGPTAQTMKVLGQVNGHTVKILFDSGSSHNFVDSKLIKHCGWQAQPTQTFEVMIADGGKVTSSGCCKAMELILAGPVLWDFQLLTMEFTKNHHPYKLSHHSSSASGIQEVSLHQLQKKLTNSNLGLFLYSLENEKLDSYELSSVQLQELQHLLNEFEAIFAVPTKLPPQRDHDHHIPLMHGAKPPSI